MSAALSRRLASLSLGAGPSTFSCSCKVASTSAVSVTANPSFHTSASVSERRRKLVARLKKKNNLARRVTARQRLAETAPDPIRGYGPGNEQIWLNSELRKILLDKEEVWAGPSDTAPTTAGAIGGQAMLPSLASPEAETLGKAGVTALLPDPSMQSVQDSIQQSSQPKTTALVPAGASPPTTAPSATAPLPYLNFGLSAEDAKLLFEQLPKASAELKTTPEMLSAMRNTRVDSDLIDEKQKAESLKRILDMRNANSRGIRFENTRRIVRRFGQGEGTGRCEVQAAILTMRIHSLADHFDRMMRRDTQSKMGMARLVHERAKVLKYLKRYDLNRYVQCLSDIGVEQRAVEGEIILRKKAPGAP